MAEMKIKTRFVFFCFVGVLSLLVDWIFFNLFYSFGLTFVVSRFLGIAISMVFCFNVNRVFTFSSKGKGIKKHAAKWIILYLCTMCVNVLVGRAVVAIIGKSVISANIAFFSGIAAATPINFLGSLIWVFKKNKKERLE